ncbi:PREDICTED: secretoglobin family 1D member 4-like [Colobus angolensis palliatus]|uniref:secretoglobin family 1D member 4-like n=1 Tax=Colobus angolensis palliatus TaxID=336983 RepID=UPI0005F54144|nr:PREDICTED: secretoglobin family 1D member 4-like [Colobus angolensis palliatus]
MESYGLGCDSSHTLSVCLLLVSLALCCYQANALVCPALASEITGFFFLSDDLLKLQVAKFNPPPEALEAKLQVKHCTDKIPLED